MTRVLQGLSIAGGTIVAAVMIWLGLWQMQVFTDSGMNTASARAAAPPVELLAHVHPDGTVDDIYARRVTSVGVYLPDQQILVRGNAGVPRVLSALRLDDGRVLAVVRGRAESLPKPPPGRVEISGVFLASEPGAESPAPPGELGSVRLAALAQLWPQQLLPGYVTLGEADARAQGLDPAPITLPSGDGALRNGGYAIQWWVFAAFALGMGIKISHDLGRRRLADVDTSPGADKVDAGG